MPDRFFVIVNPVSGRGAGERAIPLIISGFQQNALDYDLVRTERPWHAAELARQAAREGFSVVVAAGGDGTANEVLNGLMQARTEGLQPALGILCVGRGNDFAFGAGLPKDLRQALRVLASGRRRQIDVGKVTGGLYPQGRYFGNGVGIGFDAVVGFEALKMKRLSGFLSYIAAALKTVYLFDHGPTVRIEYDGQSRTQAALMVSVMNGRRLGGGFMMAPQGDPTDGRLDVCVAAQVSRARILGLIPHFMKGDQASQPSIWMARSQRVRVTAESGALPAHADGETICVDGKVLEVEVQPAALQVICEQVA
jgi:YegS/Rv2252/BmrU family lipid kinase